MPSISKVFILKSTPGGKKRIIRFGKLNKQTTTVSNTVMYRQFVQSSHSRIQGISQLKIAQMGYKYNMNISKLIIS